MRRIRFSWFLGLVLVPLPVRPGRAAEPDLERLGDMAAYRRVCDAVRTEASVLFEGDEVQRGKARAEWRRHRDEVLGGVYTAEIVAQGFSFGEYEYEQKKLPLDLGRALRPADGAELTSRAGSDEDLSFQVSPEVAQAIVRARAAGKLKLRVTFRLATTSELPDPCVRLAGGRSLKARIDPLAFDLIGENTRATAHAESPRYRDAVAEYMPVAQPRVRIRAAKTDDLNEPALVKTLESSILGCYRTGLSHNARLRGSLVVGVALDKDGRVEWARPEIDAIGDDALVGCTMERVKGQHFPRGKAHLSIPVFFQGSE